MLKQIITLGVSLILCGSASAAIVINEFRPNPPGGDPGVELVELRATAGETSFSGFWASIEGDEGFDIQDDGIIDITFDANGLATFDTGNIENPTFTFFVSASDHSGASSIGEITTAIDAVGITDSSSDVVYGDTLGGTDFSFVNLAATSDEYPLVFRDAASLEWYGLDSDGTVYFSDGSIQSDQFNVSPSETFGSINPTTVTAVPEPSMLLGATCLSCLLAFRRRRPSMKP